LLFLIIKFCALCFQINELIFFSQNHCFVHFSSFENKTIITTATPVIQALTEPALPETPALAADLTCSRCERRAPAYCSLLAAIDYAYPGDMLIQRFKEGGHLAYAGLFV
jgi:hypothetical protein